MALLAEEIVEEWLNRNGYFTIRGIKLGVQEIDLLAIAIHGKDIDARHIEVQASVRPIGYISRLSKETQKATGHGATSVWRRSSDEIADGIDEWVNKKYNHPAKKQLRNILYKGEWKFELVVHHVKFDEELKLIEKHGIKIYQLDEIIESLSENKTPIQSAAGADLLDLVRLGHDDVPTKH